MIHLLGAYLASDDRVIIPANEYTKKWLGFAIRKTARCYVGAGTQWIDLFSKQSVDDSIVLAGLAQQEKTLRYIDKVTKANVVPFPPSTRN